MMRDRTVSTITLIAGLALAQVASAEGTNPVPNAGNGAPVRIASGGVMGLADTRPVQAAAPTTTPISHRLGVIDAAVSTRGIGAMDAEPYIAEDVFTNVKGSPYRYGVVREIDATVTDGHWMAVNGGYLWSLNVNVEGTNAVRVHFSDVNLPSGAELVAYSNQDAFYITGPITDDGPLNDGQFWGQLMPGTSARVEMFVPAQHFAQVQAQTPFRIDRVVDAYSDPFKDEDEGGIAGGAGACHNVPSCFSPTWDNVRKAVGRIDFIDGGFGFLCSGQLMNTTANDQTPYFLTAAHCISNNTVANTATIFWKFERPTCMGAVTTQGNSQFCTLVATFGTADESLLMVEGSLLTNMFWVGWVNAEPGSGQASTCLHHPSGDFMRISFGNKGNTPNCGGSSTNFMLCSWTSGVTEGGSSGSGIYRNDTQQLYGTLTCGGSACIGAGGNGQPDSYGQFDRSLNSGGFAAPLAVGSDDAQEQNDSCAGAIATVAGTYLNRIVKSTDEDWYRITIPNNGGISVSTTFTHAWGDINLQLYGTCGGSVLTSSTGTGNSEALSFTNTGATADFFLRVFLAADTRNQYDMVISTIGPPNDNCSSPEGILDGSYPFNTGTASTDGPPNALCNVNGSNDISNDVWYQYFPFGCTGTATASVCGASFNTRIAVYTDCPGIGGTIIACNDDFCGTSSSVSFPVVDGNFYMIRVGGHLGATGTGTLTVGCVPTGPACPADIAPIGSPNGVVDIDDLTQVILNWGTNDANADIDDSGLVDIDDLTQVILAWGPC